MNNGQVHTNGRASANGHAAHSLAVAEEADPAVPRQWETEVFTLCGADRNELVARLADLKTIVSGQSPPELVDMAATLADAFVTEGAERIALVAGTHEDLLRRIDRASERLSDPNCHQITDAAGIYYAEKPLYAPGRLAFLFPGEGAQYLSMLGDLEPHFPELRDYIDQGGRIFSAHDDGPFRIEDVFRFPRDVQGPEREAADRELGQLDRTMFSVLLGCLCVNEVLEQLKIVPDCVAGHSAGELAALSAVGCFSDSAGLENIPGMMGALREGATDNEHAEALLFAVGASREAMANLIQSTQNELIASGADPQIYIAMDNCPHQTVLVGAPAAMLVLEEQLQARKLMYERLPFTRPYHTHLFEPYLERLSEHFVADQFQAAKKTVYSCTTTKPFPSDPAAMRDLAIAHWASPVRFTEMVRQMHADGVRLFVEAGPRGNLSSFVTDILRGEQFLAVPANTPRRAGVTQLNHLVGQLAAHGVPLDYRPFYARRSPQRVDWPAAATSSSTAATQATETLTSATSTLADPLATTATATAPPAPQSSPAAPLVAAAIGNPTQFAASSPQGTVVNQFFHVMEQFLDDQQTVIQSYLAQRGRRPRRVVRRGAPRRSTAAAVAPSATLLPAAAPVDHAIAPNTETPTTTAPAEALHAGKSNPLIGEIVAHEPGQRIVMRRRLDVSEDLYAGEHTVGGREVSQVDPSQHGLPVMPMTFNLEMMAEVANQLVPGQVTIAIRDVQLARWLAFEEDVSLVEVEAEVMTKPPKDPQASASAFVRVEVRDLGHVAEPNLPGATAATGTVVLAPQYPEPPGCDLPPLANPHPPVPTLEQMYRNLFHGPSFQGVYQLDTMGDEGIQSQCRVLPRDTLFRSNKNPQFLLDPVTLDIIMHPSAAWHLEQPDQSGRILLPYELKRIEFYGPAPAVGDEFECQSRVGHTSPRQFSHDGDVFDRQGRIWCRLRNVRSWRFYLPFGEVNFHGPKDEYFLTQDWPGLLPPGVLDGAADEAESFGGKLAPSDVDAWCVRFTPSADLLQPALQTAAAQVTLSKNEQRELRDLRLPPAEHTRSVFGRIAAKDAARILWRLHNGARLFPADIEIGCDGYRRPTAALRGGNSPADFPAVSFAATDRFMVGVATRRRLVGVGLVDLEAPLPTAPAPIEIVGGSELEEEETQARLAATCQAVVAALGPELVDAARLRIERYDALTEIAYVQLDTALASTFPEFLGRSLVVRTARHEEHVAAVTLCDCEEPAA